jgi:hypothetical protein
MVSLSLSLRALGSEFQKLLISPSDWNLFGFDYDWPVILINAERSDSPAVVLAGGALQGKEADAKQRLQISLDESV